MTFALSASAFVIGWVWNTYLMVFVLEGSTVESENQTAATADEHSANGLFWLLLFSLLAGLGTYAWSRGWKDFRSDLATLPRLFAEAMTRSRTSATAMLLWGAAVGLVISTLISSAVSLALGLVLLALAASPIGIILNFALIRLWRGLCGIVAPVSGPQLAATLSPFMVMLGEALGLFVDWMIGVWLVGLLVGVACAVASLVLMRGNRPRGAAVVILVSVAIVCQLARVRWAYADDGGWSECFTPDGRACSEAGLGGLFAWAGSPGAGYVMAMAAIGGVSSSAGAAVGAGIGGAAAGLASAAAGLTNSPTQTESRRPISTPSPGEADEWQGLSGHGGRADETAHGAAGVHPVSDEAAPGRAGGGAASSQTDGADSTQTRGGDSSRTVGAPSDIDSQPGRSAEGLAQSGDAAASHQGDSEAGNEGTQSRSEGATSGSARGADAGPKNGDTASSSVSDEHSGNHPYFDLGDILPEEPDRHDDESDPDGEDHENGG